MKLKNILATLLLATVTTVFAATGLNDINMLVEKINKTTDQQEKAKLLDELDVQLGQVEDKDIEKAHELVNKKLKVSKTKVN